MWSRRAQEYVAKLRDLVSIAEVGARPVSLRGAEQSYLERQLYEEALDRMVRG